MRLEHCVMSVGEPVREGGREGTPLHLPYMMWYERAVTSRRWEESARLWAEPRREMWDCSSRDPLTTTADDRYSWCECECECEGVRV